MTFILTNQRNDVDREEEKLELDEQPSNAKDTGDDEDDKDVNDSSDDRDVDDDDSKESSLPDFIKNSKLGKELLKTKRKTKKTKKYVHTKFKSLKQLLILVFIVIVVLMWSTVESILHWLAGQDQINIVSKTTENGCYEIVTDENESYCVDEASYNLVDTQGIYLVEKYQYHYKLREDKQREF